MVSVSGEFNHGLAWEKLDRDNGCFRSIVPDVVCLESNFDLERNNRAHPDFAALW